MEKNFVTREERRKLLSEVKFDVYQLSVLVVIM